VDFGKKRLKKISVYTQSVAGGTIQIRANGINGPVISEVKITQSSEWEISKASVLKFEPGVKNIFIVMKEGKQVEADWISFE
jgi:hypothetical protein